MKSIIEVLNNDKTKLISYLTSEVNEWLKINVWQNFICHEHEYEYEEFLGLINNCFVLGVSNVVFSKYYIFNKKLNVNL